MAKDTAQDTAHARARAKLPGASDSRVVYTKIFFGRAVKAEMVSISVSLPDGNQAASGMDFYVSLHLRNVERVYHKFMHMSSCPDRVIRASLHIAATFEGATEGAFVGILQVAANGQAASKAGDANTAGG